MLILGGFWGCGAPSLVKMLICRFMDLRQTLGGYGNAGGHPNLMDLLAMKKNWGVSWLVNMKHMISKSFEITF